jgi:hypothetical protein
MRSIFLKLWNHCSKEARPEEDYFTEIIGHLFAERPDLLYNWLEKLGISVPGKPVLPNIRTQQQFKAGLWAGRYDLFIEIDQPGWRQLVAIESKVRSSEGPNQLGKYIHDLTSRLGENVQAALIYITRNIEPEKSLDTGTVCFRQSRWKDFVEFLDSQPNKRTDWLLLEIIAFMKESRIGIPFDITENHLSAFANFSECLALFDEVLDNKVALEFQKLGGRILKKTSRLRSLKNNWVYGHISGHEDWSIGFHVGFWRNHHENGSRVGGYVCINPRKLDIGKAIEKARAALVASASQWEQYQTNNVVRDPGFVRSEPIDRFLHLADQEQALTKVLLGVVSDLQAFKVNFGLRSESFTEVDAEE